MKKHVNQNKGITLIALIITIIVLLILAVVTIAAISGNGIINHAENARDSYQTAQETENTQLTGYESYLDAGAAKANGGTSEPQWTLTTDSGDTGLSVGDLITSKKKTTEQFYVIGIDGNTVSLLAQYNIKYNETTEKYEQDTEGGNNPCAFSELENLSFTAGENLNNNPTVKADTTSAVYKAYQYGKTVGVETGRLLLYNDPNSSIDTVGLQTANSTILYGASENEKLNYWLGSADSGIVVWTVYGEGSDLGGSNYDFDFYGVRPVIEVSASSIE